MKKTISTLFTATVLLTTSCNNAGNSASANRPQTAEELKMELKQQEQSNPTQYLSITASMKENKVKTRDEGLFRNAEYSTDGYNIEGTIKNSASVARFKDVIVTVTFLSKTETAIEEKEFSLYEFYEPNATKAFSLHAYPPEAMEKFNVSIKDATAVN